MSSPSIAADADAAAPAAAADVPSAAASALEHPSAALNQFWYSARTIRAMVEEVLSLPGPAVFLATPSLFFAVPAAVRAARGDALLDIDAQSFDAAQNFHVFDFRGGAAALPPALRARFALAVIDPPFITADAWEPFAEAADALLAPGGAVIATSVRENEALLARLLGLRRTPFLPSIPQLVYQYSTFVRGFEPTVLGRANPEIPGED